MVKILLGLSLILLISWTTLSFAQHYQAGTETSGNISHREIPFSQKTIHYALAGDSSKPGILFIHGTPGSWQAFQSYLNDKDLQKKYFLVSIDRPGWGQSKTNLASSQNSLQSDEVSVTTQSSFAFQARSILAVMQQYPDKKWILVGHSLGASIAPRVALLQPKKIKGMLLLSGSFKPKLGKPRWYNRLANTLLVSWMLPAHWQYSNREIMALSDELNALENDLNTQKLDIHVVLIQGMRDRLVSPKNAEYVRKHWPRSFSEVDVVELPNAGHFIVWRQTPLILKKLNDFVFD